MIKDTSKIQYEETVDFISKFNDIFYQTLSFHLGSFIEDSFFKDLFEKNPSKAVDKAQLLIEKFGKTADSANFTAQIQTTNIQPTTLLLIFFISSTDEPNVVEFNQKINELRSKALKPVVKTPPILPISALHEPSWLMSWLKLFKLSQAKP
ncbi:hypothetical protein RhiirA1_473915 [Rhizophagus irregularis]|uniref:Uncharacterized protein n=1 Tax=Rhizophagus irregularis TaxID=588596 RepID=A0A2I1E9R7_9GLOM|nr:hypothetical protein RhiirA1_473915 [Rhizophagus irregularis]PKY18856.1 hypothetical protein RhiirB3_431763 [Rhizophagus irregularis]